MKKSAVEDVLDVLKDIRAKLHSNVDKRTVRDLRDEVDKAIAELEAMKKRKMVLTPLELLTIIAAVVSKIDLIAQAIEHLTKR